MGIVPRLMAGRPRCFPMDAVTIPWFLMDACMIQRLPGTDPATAVAGKYKQKREG